MQDSVFAAAGDQMQPANLLAAEEMWPSHEKR